MSSQVKQNKAFWRVTSNCLEKRLKGDGAAGKEVRKKGFQVCGPSRGTWTRSEMGMCRKLSRKEQYI